MTAYSQSETQGISLMSLVINRCSMMHFDLVELTNWVLKCMCRIIVYLEILRLQKAAFPLEEISFS